MIGVQMMTTTRQFLDVRMPGREFTLEGDAALLFQAKARLGQPFDFDVPGGDGPIRVDFHGLRTTARRVPVPDSPTAVGDA